MSNRIKKDVFREVPEVVHGAVEDALDAVRESGGRRIFRMPAAAAACLALFLAGGVTVSAVGLVSLYRQRMEEMDADEIGHYYDVAGNGDADTVNRALTEKEHERYDKLEQEYEKNGRFPQSDLRELADGEVYDGNGIALEPESRAVYLPERELTDEELLELIDFHHRLTYSIYQVNQARILNGDGWESRLARMSDDEVDAVYQAAFSTLEDVSGGYSRELTESERERYAELEKSYEEDGVYTDVEAAVIQTPEEYSGEGVAICVRDGAYYLPEETLTDEELLQLIDYEHKAAYCIDRIGQEILMGLRDGYPQRADSIEVPQEPEQAPPVVPGQGLTVEERRQIQEELRLLEEQR